MIVAAIIIAVLAFLLFCPTHIVIRYAQNKFFVYIRLWFLIKINLVKDKIKTETKPEEKERQKSKFEIGPISTRLEQLSILFRLAASLIKQFCKHFALYRCRIKINVSGEDPADVATEYGLVNAAAYGIISYLNEIIKIGKKEIAISCDYDGELSEFELDLRFRVIFLNFVLVLICTNIRDIIALLQTMSQPREIEQEVK